MALMGNKKTNANSVLPHAPCQGKNTISVFIFWKLTGYGRKIMIFHANKTCSFGRRRSICCMLEHDIETRIIFEAV